MYTRLNEKLKSLNPAQRSAVEEIDGVVMVVAGPGTGKTQVLGARVAHILQQTDTHADNILCLTFTEAATVALRNRLIEFIGPEAHRVNIYTYHAFCNSVIQDNKHLFGYSDLDPVSELEVLEIVKEIIDELSKDHPLKRFKGDAYFDSSNLIKLFGLMKKDRMSPASVDANIERLLQQVELDESYRYKTNSKHGKKGDLKPEYYRLTDQLRKLSAAASLLENYQRKLLQRKRYDYNDMIHWVIDELENNENLLLSYQERYHYVLVDEYQDTNGSQNQLLYLLINYWENPNVFVVGDDDQSIYKFQGANVANIRQFYERYAKYAKLFVLEENYRSTPNILGISGQLIEHNKERLVGQVAGLSKQIRSAHPDYKDIQTPVAIHEYDNLYQEVVGLVKTLKKLNEAGIPWKEMAVLYRNHKQSGPLMSYLTAQNIPYNVTVSMDILEIPIIKQLITLMRYLHLESEKLDKGQYLLFEILHFLNFRHLNAFEVAQLSVRFRANYKQGWREQLHQDLDKKALAFLSEASRKELTRFVQDLEYWQKQLFNVNLQTTVEQLMSKGGFVSRALSGTDNIFEIQCLKSFFDFVKEETAKKPNSTLADLIATIDLMETNHLKLNLNKVIHGADGINLMTAHGSKGLEFEHVHVLGCTSNQWEKDRKTLPFNLNKIIEGEPRIAHEEEGRRLFYVAMTRAKSSLCISYAKQDEGNKALTESMFVSEIKESKYAKLEHIQNSEREVMEFFAQSLDSTSESYQQLTQLDFVDQQLERFRLNATSLNAYLKCPVAFFYQHILHVPSAKNEYMSFGSAVHGALELLFRQKNASPELLLPGSDFLVEKFRSGIMQHQESFTRESLNRYLEHGAEILPLYYDHAVVQWQNQPKVEVEVDIKNVEVDGIPIRGKIDKLIVNANDLQVVDYKTGKRSKALSKMKPPLPIEKLKAGEKDHNKLLGGDYWRQLVFYRILLEADPRFTSPVTSGLLDFVEPEKGAFHLDKVSITEHDKQLVIAQIKEAYSAIINKEFDNGCNDEHCVWCKFNSFYMNKDPFMDHNLLKLDKEEMEER